MPALREPMKEDKKYYYDSCAFVIQGCNHINVCTFKLNVYVLCKRYENIKCCEKVFLITLNITTPFLFLKMSKKTYAL